MYMNDEDIYKRFLEYHNNEDFRILLERHREGLLLFLMSFVHNMDDAEELMLDAFAEVASARSFLAKSSFKTWLYSIGKHQALMLFRKNRRLVSLDENMSDESRDNTPELEIMNRERNQTLYLAMKKLNDEYRQVLTLLYFEEMSLEEIEKIMGKSRKQIYNLTERGKKALRTELERMGINEF